MAMVEFFYDVGSPYSYLAATQIEAIVADAGGAVTWRPFLVGGVFKAVENTPPAFNPAKARYMAADLQRWAAWYGVPFEVKMPPMNTLLAMRALAATPEDQRPAASLALFRAWWVEGRDVQEAAVVAEVLGAEAVTAATTQAAKDSLRANTDEAVARGAFGAPTMFVGRAMYFGNDRLPMLANRLRSAS